MGLHVGLQVVCVSDVFSPCPYWRRAVRSWPKLHMIYTIRDMREVKGLVGLCFFEFVNPREHFFEGYAEPAFKSQNFRPVRRTSIEIFERLLAPAPVDVLETV